MSFTADEYYNMYLALGVAENNALFSCKDIPTYIKTLPKSDSQKINWRSFSLLDSTLILRPTQTPPV
jgi:hypothetical protein